MPVPLINLKKSGSFCSGKPAAVLQRNSDETLGWKKIQGVAERPQDGAQRLQRAEWSLHGSSSSAQPPAEAR